MEASAVRSVSGIPACRLPLPSSFALTTFPLSCSGSPGEIVHNHIRLLGQYNEAKDIAQQLIGLIADNRGVPVGSLYRGDRYGVGAND